MQRRLTPRECPVLQDIDGDVAAVLSHDGLLPTEELVTALTDFIPAETVKSCRLQLFEVARGIYSEAIGDGEQTHTVPLRLKARRGATARASCARDLVKLFTYICGLLPHFPRDTLVTQNHLLMTQLESQSIQQSTSSPPQRDSNTLDSHQSNTERPVSSHGDTHADMSMVSRPLVELVDRCSDHDRAIVDMQCTLNNALNELDKLKHKNTHQQSYVLSPDATVCSHSGSPDNEYPCPAQPIRDPGHQQQQDVYSPNMSSDNSSILLTLGDNSPSPGQPLHRDNHQHTEKPHHVGSGTDAILPTPECSFGIIDGENASLTALLQSTPHNSSDRNEHITRSTVVDRSVVCNLFDSDLKSSVDKILVEMSVMKKNYADLEERVCAIEARHNSDEDRYQSLCNELHGIGENMDSISRSVQILATQLKDKTVESPTATSNADVAREVVAVPCSNRFAVLDIDDAVDFQHNADTTPAAAPGPVRPKRSSHNGSGRTGTSRRQRQHKRRTKVSIVGSSLVRGLGNMVNKDDTDVCCHTFPGGTVERIAPRLPEVTHADDDVIVIGAGSNNIPQHDVPTIIRRVGEMIDDIQEIRPNAHLIIPAIPRRYDDPDSRDIYRDKIDRVNVFLQHKCKKSSKLHFLRHNFRFEDYKGDGLHFNQRGLEKYAQNLYSLISMIACDNK